MTESPFSVRHKEYPLKVQQCDYSSRLSKDEEGEAKSWGSSVSKTIKKTVTNLENIVDSQNLMCIIYRMLLTGFNQTSAEILSMYCEYRVC